MQKNYNHRYLPASDGWRFNVSLHRHLGRLCALLLTLLAVNATAWADNTLFEADFIAMTPEETTTTNRDYDKVINGVSVRIRSKYSITSTMGLQFTEGNITKNRGFIAIPLNNINGAFTVTVQHKAISGSTNSVRYMYSDGKTLDDYDTERARISTTQGSETAFRVQSEKGGASLSFTVSNTDNKGLLFIGRYNPDTNIEKITITTPNGQVTPTPVDVMLEASNLSLEVDQTGSSTITAKANGSIVSGLTYSYSSDNPSVATVNRGTGAVTAWTPGTATITVNSDETDSYNSASTNFTVTVREASTSIGESVRWDFTTTTAAEAISLENFTNNETNSVSTSDAGVFTSNNRYTLTDADGNEPNVLKGLQFSRTGNWGTGMMIYYGSNACIRFVLEKYSVHVPNLMAGNKVRVTWCSSYNNETEVKISGTNMTAPETTPTVSTSMDRITTEFVVNRDGWGTFTFEKNAYLYKIEVDRAPDIAYNETIHGVKITQLQNKTVKYTTDGSDPRTSATAQTATPPVNFTVDGTCTIYAVAVEGEQVYSRVAEENIIFPGTYQYTMSEIEDTPNAGEVVENKDGNGNVVLRMTYGALPEFRDNSDNKVIWKTPSRDGDIRSAEFQDYSYTTVGDSFDGTSEDGYDKSKCYGSQFFSSEQNTPFSLPIAGAYVKFEPECDGKLQVVIRQNGAFTTKTQKDNEGNEYIEPDKTMRKRVVYFADETGRAFIPEQEYTAQMNLNSMIDNQLFTFYSEREKFKNDDDYTNNFPFYKQLLGLSSTASFDEWTAMAGSSVPNIMVTATDNNGEGTGEGYLVVSKAYVKYTINVKAGKTYFLTGNLTKVGLCGYQFTPDATYAGRKNAAAQLQEGESGGTAVNTTLLNNGNVNKPMDVKVYRRFEADTWATLVLPFSVSASKVREVFGDGTLILNFADVTNEVNEDGKPIINLHLRKHYHQMIVAGMPLLIRPARTVENATYSNVTLEKLNVTPMSQDIHATADNFREGYKLNGSYEPTVMPAYAYYLVGDEFKQKTNGNTTNSKGMRAWIGGASGPFQAKVNYVEIYSDIEDDLGISTEVEQIAEALGLQPVVTGAIYNLNGQKVSADGNRDGLPAGVYVQNGKKFVVR